MDADLVADMHPKQVKALVEFLKTDFYINDTINPALSD